MTAIRNGIALEASFGRSRELPAIAERKSRFSATDKNRGGRIGPVVHILVEQAIGGTAPADKADRVHAEHQHSLASIVARLRKEDDRLAEGELDLVHPVRMLHQEEAQIGGGPVRGGEREEHG